MLDPRDPLSFADVAGVIVYRDDATPTGFYALPATPRIATGGDGNPLITLIVYGRRTRTEFIPSGGFLSVTTSLALTPDEDRRIRAALAEQLARAFPQRPEDRALEPDLRPVEWLDGDVDIVLARDMRLSGKPSLFAGNQCAFSMNLDARQIGPFLEAWHHSLPDAAITYAMTLRTASADQATARFDSHRSWSGDTSRGEAVLSVRARSGSAVGQSEIEFKGPLMASDMDPGRFLTTAAL